MEWLSDNWFIVALFGGMAAWHLFGRKHGAGQGGCCSGGALDSGGCCGGDEPAKEQKQPAIEDERAA